eukprot:UN03731
MILIHLMNNFDIKNYLFQQPNSCSLICAKSKRYSTGTSEKTLETSDVILYNPSIT